MSEGITYTVVVPVRNEEEVLPECCRQLAEVMRSTGEPYELLFVDDGSTDGTLLFLERLAENEQAVRVIRLSRSFGHQIALTAGIDRARGDAVVTIDADLQDPPSAIPRMISRWKEGADVVVARRTRRRGERLAKRAGAYLFSRLLRRIAAVPIPVDTADFRLLDRKVCEWLRRIPERHRYLRGLVSWVGFTQAEVLYERQGRFAGRPKYRLLASASLAVDAVTSFSTAPLRIALSVGILAIAAGLGFLVFALVRGRVAGSFGGEWAVIASVLVILNGTTLMLVGLLGAYVGRIFEEVKRRPLYVVQKLIGFKESERPEQPPMR